MNLRKCMMSKYRRSMLWLRQRRLYPAFDVATNGVTRPSKADPWDTAPAVERWSLLRFPALFAFLSTQGAAVKPSTDMLHPIISFATAILVMLVHSLSLTVAMVRLFLLESIPNLIFHLAKSTKHLVNKYSKKINLLVKNYAKEVKKLLHSWEGMPAAGYRDMCIYYFGPGSAGSSSCSDGGADDEDSSGDIRPRTPPRREGESGSSSSEVAAPVDIQTMYHTCRRLHLRDGFSNVFSNEFHHLRWRLQSCAREAASARGAVSANEIGCNDYIGAFLQDGTESQRILRQPLGLGPIQETNAPRALVSSLLSIVRSASLTPRDLGHPSSSSSQHDWMRSLSARVRDLCDSGNDQPEARGRRPRAPRSWSAPERDLPSHDYHDEMEVDGDNRIPEEGLSGGLSRQPSGASAKKRLGDSSASTESQPSTMMPVASPPAPGSADITSLLPSKDRKRVRSAVGRAKETGEKEPCGQSSSSSESDPLSQPGSSARTCFVLDQLEGRSGSTLTSANLRIVRMVSANEYGDAYIFVYRMNRTSPDQRGPPNLDDEVPVLVIHMAASPVRISFIDRIRSRRGTNDIILGGHFGATAPRARCQKALFTPGEQDQPSSARQILKLSYDIRLLHEYNERGRGMFEFVNENVPLDSTSDEGESDDISVSDAEVDVEGPTDAEAYACPRLASGGSAMSSDEPGPIYGLIEPSSNGPVSYLVVSCSTTTYILIFCRTMSMRNRRTICVVEIPRDTSMINLFFRHDITSVNYRYEENVCHPHGPALSSTLSNSLPAIVTQDGGPPIRVSFCSKPAFLGLLVNVCSASLTFVSASEEYEEGVRRLREPRGVAAIVRSIIRKRVKARLRLYAMQALQVRVPGASPKRASPSKCSRKRPVVSSDEAKDHTPAKTKREDQQPQPMESDEDSSDASISD